MFLLFLLFAICTASLPEENLSVPDLIRYWGYPVESHQAVTEDGYFLTIHRIPHGRSNSSGSKPAVFLQHGLLCSSSNWVTNLPHQSLGFILADRGFDVWMGNVRGNTYSDEHREYEKDSDAYWNFSFDEMAQYDLPAMVEYVLKTTNQSSLYYVGHSQGTMIAFAGLSENPRLQKQIKIVYALAPVAHLGNTVSPVEYLAYFESGISYFFELFGIREFLPSTKWIRELGDEGCPLDEDACDNVLFAIAGNDKSNMNKTRTPVYFTHTPAGTSVKNMLHFGQLINQNQFQRYDYGFFKNFLKYGWRGTPPKYDLKKIPNKIALISGGRDTLSVPKDVDWLSKELSHVLVDKRIAEYNHLDFIWGMDANFKVYGYIINSILKYETHNWIE